MVTFVLVHGAWHGAWSWRRVARRLTARGHEVFTPTLTGLAERSHLLRGNAPHLGLKPGSILRRKVGPRLPFARRWQVRAPTAWTARRPNSWEPHETQGCHQPAWRRGRVVAGWGADAAGRCQLSDSSSARPRKASRAIYALEVMTAGLMDPSPRRRRRQALLHERHSP
jgi:hypothetical protein